MLAICISICIFGKYLIFGYLIEFSVIYGMINIVNKGGWNMEQMLVRAGKSVYQGIAVGKIFVLKKTSKFFEKD